MKKLTKILSLVCAFVLVLTGTIMLTGCKEEKDPPADPQTSAVEFLTSNIDLINTAFAPSTETSKLASDLDEWGDYGDVGEFAFMDMSESVLQLICEYEKNGEYIKSNSYAMSVVYKTGENKYKCIMTQAYEDTLDKRITDIEIKLLENDVLQLIASETEDYESENEYYITEYNMTIDLNKKLIVYETESELSDEEGNCIYSNETIIEIKIEGNKVYAQRFEQYKEYEDDLVVEQGNWLYEVESVFAWQTNVVTNVSEVVVSEFIGCAERNVSSVYSLKDGIPVGFASDNIDVEWER